MPRHAGDPPTSARLGVALPLWAGIGVVGVASFELITTMRRDGESSDEDRI